MHRSIFLASVLFAATPAFAANYEIDPAHTSAQFSIRHLMVSNVRGEFSKIKGTVQYDPANPAAAKIEATIESNSINTRNSERDEHLRKEEFFDVTKYPTLSFKSKKVEAAGAGKLKVTGDLSIRGVTKEVVLDVDGPTAEIKDPWGNTKIGASATTKLNRQDFGLSWNKALDAGGVVVGDDVTVTIDVELIKNPQPAKS